MVFGHRKPFVMSTYCLTQVVHSASASPNSNGSKFGRVAILLSRKSSSLELSLGVFGLPDFGMLCPLVRDWSWTVSRSFLVVSIAIDNSFIWICICFIVVANSSKLGVDPVFLIPLPDGMDSLEPLILNLGQVALANWLLGWCWLDLLVP